MTQLAYHRVQSVTTHKVTADGVFGAVGRLGQLRRLIRQPHLLSSGLLPVLSDRVFPKSFC